MTTKSYVINGVGSDRLYTTALLNGDHVPMNAKLLRNADGNVYKFPTRTEAREWMRDHIKPERISPDDVIRKPLENADYFIEDKPLINWIKFDPDNPPPFRKQFLVTDGEDCESASLHPAIGIMPMQWYYGTMSLTMENVTHYAEINLPLITEEKE